MKKSLRFSFDCCFFIGRSPDPVYAKRFAVKAAYESVLHRDYPDDKIIRGDQCYQDSQYYLVESEANHVYVIYKKVVKYLTLCC